MTSTTAAEDVDMDMEVFDHQGDFEMSGTAPNQLATLRPTNAQRQGDTK